MAAHSWRMCRLNDADDSHCQPQNVRSSMDDQVYGHRRLGHAFLMCEYQATPVDQSADRITDM